MDVVHPKLAACVQTSPISLLHAEKGRLRNRVPIIVFQSPAVSPEFWGPCSDWLLDPMRWKATEAKRTEFEQ